MTAELELRGYTLLLSVIHWVMAVNRKIALGEKIGMPNERGFKFLGAGPKIGFGPKTFHQARLMARNLKAGVLRAEDFISEKFERCKLWFSPVRGIYSYGLTEPGHSVLLGSWVSFLR